MRQTGDEAGRRRRRERERRLEAIEP